MISCFGCNFPTVSNYSHWYKTANIVLIIVCIVLVGNKCISCTSYVNPEIPTLNIYIYIYCITDTSYRLNIY
jgi:hypothetical protein